MKLTSMIPRHRLLLRLSEVSQWRTVGPLIATLLLILFTQPASSHDEGVTLIANETFAKYPSWEGLNYQPGTTSIDLIRFTIKTSEQDGLLLYTEHEFSSNLVTGKEYLLLRLKQGQLVLKGKRYLDRQFPGYFIPNYFSYTVNGDQPLNDNNAHNIILRRSVSGEVTLEVQDQSAFVATTELDDLWSIGSISGVFVGGLPSNFTPDANATVRGVDYIGCLQDINFIFRHPNGSLFPLPPSEYSDGVIYDCVDPCTNVSCGDGRCISRWPTTATCDCSLTTLGGPTCNEDPINHRITLDSNMNGFYCYTLSNLPYIPRPPNTGSVRLIPPIAENGTLMTGISLSYDLFYLFLNECVLSFMVKPAGHSQPSTVSIDGTLDPNTSYQIDFAIKNDSIQLNVSILNAASNMQVQAVNSTLLNSLSDNNFESVCIGGGQFEHPFYVGILERVYFNRFALSEERNAELYLRDIVRPSNVISLQAGLLRPPLTFNRFNVATHRRISFDIRVEQNSLNSFPLLISNTENKIQFLFLNGHFAILVFVGTKLIIYEDCTIPDNRINDNSWHNVDIRLILGEDANSTDIKLEIDNSFTCRFSNLNETQMRSLRTSLNSLIESRAAFNLGSPGQDSIFVGCFRNIAFRVNEDNSSVKVSPDLSGAILTEEKFSIGRECFSCTEEVVYCSGVGESCIDCGFFEGQVCTEAESLDTIRTICDGAFTTTTTMMTTAITTTSSPTNETASSLTRVYIGVAVGAFVTVLLLILLVVIVVVIWKRNASERGFYQTDEVNGHATSMVHYSASLGQISSEQVMTPQQNGIGPNAISTQVERPKEFYM